MPREQAGFPQAYSIAFLQATKYVKGYKNLKIAGKAIEIKPMFKQKYKLQTVDK